MIATIGILAGISLYFLLVHKAHGFSIPFINDSYVAKSYEVIIYAGNQDNIQFVQGVYIQPNTPVSWNLNGLDIGKLIKPTKERVLLPWYDDDVRWAGQCVGYVKYHLRGIAPGLSGNANEWIQYINNDQPIVGSVAVLRIGKWGHIGFVVKEDEKTVTIRSRNYEGLWIISDNTFDRNDERIHGYITF